MLRKITLSRGNYSLRPINKEDMESIRVWRNAQMKVLRQDTPLSVSDQERYWTETLLPSFDDLEPSQVLFGFLEDDRLIGYGGITHIDWRKKAGEVSFLLDPVFQNDEDAYRSRFREFLSLIKTAAFDNLGLFRLFTETYDIRPGHIAELETSGFIFEKRNKDSVEIGNKKVDSLIHGCEAHER